MVKPQAMHPPVTKPAIKHRKYSQFDHGPDSSEIESHQEECVQDNDTDQ